ncbi:Protein HIM-4 a, partial [Aphelenchoides avenae]
APRIADDNLLHEVVVNVGRPTTLQCPAVGSPPPTITWLKDGRPLGTDGSERVSFLDGGRQLLIESAETSDSGRYVCIATNSVGATDSDLTLSVVEIPQIRGPASETVTATMNRPAELFCDVLPMESPVMIEWLKDDRPIDVSNAVNSYYQVSERGKKLHVLVAQKTDAAQWTCVAKNSAGEARKQIQLVIHMAPVFNDTLTSMPVQSYVPGTKFSLRCHVDGIPPPTIIWTKAGSPLLPSDNIRITGDGEFVLFERASEEDDGSYTCKAQNDVGAASRSFLVKITGNRERLRCFDGA